MSSINPSGSHSWSRGSYGMPARNFFQQSVAPGSENPFDCESGYYQSVDSALIYETPINTTIDFQKLFNYINNSIGVHSHLIFKHSSCPNPTMFIYNNETAASMASMMPDRINNLVFEDSAGKQVLITKYELRSGQAVQKLRNFVPVAFLGMSKLDDYFQANRRYQELVDTDSYDTYTLPASYVDFQSLLTGLESLNEFQPKIFVLKVSEHDSAIKFKDLDSLIKVMQTKRINYLVTTSSEEADFGKKIWHFNSKINTNNLDNLKSWYSSALKEGRTTEDDLLIRLYGD